jgi:hypothetical protein
VKMITCACFHSGTNYRLIFWGNSSRSAKIFKIQKNIITITQDAEVETHVEIYLRI